MHNEILHRVEYELTPNGQELVESLINLLQWMMKWSNPKKQILSNVSFISYSYRADKPED